MVEYRKQLPDHGVPTVPWKSSTLELLNAANQIYTVNYDGLRATEMRTIVSAAVYENGTRVSRTVEYSIKSYGARMAEGSSIRELCAAMLAYGDSAAGFFAK